MAEAGGVEFYLELTTKLDAATKMVRELGRVESEALKADEALKHAQKSTSMLNDVFKKVGGSFKEVGGHLFEESSKGLTMFASQFAALAGFEGVKKITETVIDLGKELFEAAGEAERTRASFQGLMGVEQADDLLDFLDHLAKSTEFTDGALKNMANQLVRTGFSGDGLERALAATLDIAARYPNKMEGAAQALDLLGHINLKGGITERQLVGAGFAPKAVFERLGGELGIGVDAVEKRLTEGKIKTNVILEALYSEIAEKTKKPLGGAGVAMSLTFLAQLEKVKDILPNLFEDLEKSKGLTKITDSLHQLTLALDPDSPSGRKIIDGLSGILDHVGDLIGKTDFDKWADRMVSVVDVLGVAIDFGAELADELGRVWDGLTGFGAAIGDVLYDITSGVGQFFSAALDLGKAVWEGMQQGIVSGITYVVDAVKNLGDAVVGKLKGVLGIHSPSKVFADLGMWSAGGYNVGLIEAQPAVMRTAEETFSPDAIFPDAAPSISAPVISAPSISAPTVGGLGGGQTINLEANVTVNVGGAPSGEGAAREQGEAVAFSVRRALEAAFEQWAAEGAGSIA